MQPPLSDPLGDFPPGNQVRQVNKTWQPQLFGSEIQRKMRRNPNTFVAAMFVNLSDLVARQQSLMYLITR